jgi:hypothetical protein
MAAAIDTMRVKLPKRVEPEKCGQKQLESFVVLTVRGECVALKNC